MTYLSVRPHRSGRSKIKQSICCYVSLTSGILRFPVIVLGIRPIPVDGASHVRGPQHIQRIVLYALGSSKLVANPY